jgi:hypothetical protein
MSHSTECKHKPIPEIENNILIMIIVNIEGGGCIELKEEG